MGVAVAWAWRHGPATRLEDVGRVASPPPASSEGGRTCGMAAGCSRGRWVGRGCTRVCWRPVIFSRNFRVLDMAIMAQYSWKMAAGLTGSSCRAQVGEGGWGRTPCLSWGDPGWLRGEVGEEAMPQGPWRAGPCEAPRGGWLVLGAGVDASGAAEYLHGLASCSL